MEAEEDSIVVVADPELITKTAISGVAAIFPDPGAIPAREDTASGVRLMGIVADTGREEIIRPAAAMANPVATAMPVRTVDTGPEKITMISEVREVVSAGTGATAMKIVDMVVATVAMLMTTAASLMVRTGREGIQINKGRGMPVSQHQTTELRRMKIRGLQDRKLVLILLQISSINQYIEGQSAL